MNREQMSAEEVRIQGLLDAFLRSEGRTGSPVGEHLDEDTIAAFADASLSEREAQGAILHLISCDACRRLTSDLNRIATELEEMPVSVPEGSAPASISEVMSDVLARLFGQAPDSAVAAYKEEEPGPDDAEGAEDDPSENRP